ncbi:hypothetical protein M3027_10290 [Geoalkalibacter halelectricus]|nr:hypothetical protein [Geoalkalibacter halelectricus]
MAGHATTGAGKAECSHQGHVPAAIGNQSIPGRFAVHNLKCCIILEFFNFPRPDGRVIIFVIGSSSDTECPDVFLRIEAKASALIVGREDVLLFVCATLQAVEITETGIGSVIAGTSIKHLEVIVNLTGMAGSAHLLASSLEANCPVGVTSKRTRCQVRLTRCSQGDVTTDTVSVMAVETSLATMGVGYAAAKFVFNVIGQHDVHVLLVIAPTFAVV